MHTHNDAGMVAPLENRLPDQAMSDLIVSIETIRAKARAAHAAGRGRNDHHMNWHAPARATWQDEWDRCEAAAQADLTALAA